MCVCVCWVEGWNIAHKEVMTATQAGTSQNTYRPVHAKTQYPRAVLSSQRIKANLADRGVLSVT